MSQDDAKSSELIKVVAKLSSTKKIEQQELTTEIEGNEGKNVNNSQEDEVSKCSGFGDEVADFEAGGDKANHEEAPFWKSEECGVTKGTSPSRDEGMRLRSGKRLKASVSVGEKPQLRKDVQESENIVQVLFGPQVNLNVDVIAEIAKFLDFYDLESLRQVDKLWCAGATPTFLRKSVVALESGARSESKLEAFASETKNLMGLSSFKFELWKAFKFEAEPQLFIQILAKLSPNLKSLQLVCWKSHPLIPIAPIKFPALTSLRIFENYEGPDGKDHRPFFQLLYASAPNLTELAISCSVPQHLSPLLADDGSRDWTLAPKLKSLVLNCNHRPAVLKALANFPQTWERLEINTYFHYLWGDEVSELLSVLLENNKDALLSLKLKVEGKLKLPEAFSKLQKLELKFIIEDGRDFLGSEIKYSKAFPALSSLSIELDIGHAPCLEMMSGIWKSLFPPQVFKGLQHFVLGLSCSHGDYAEFLRREGIAENWAQIMFPNATVEIE